MSQAEQCGPWTPVSPLGDARDADTPSRATKRETRKPAAHPPLGSRARRSRLLAGSAVRIEDLIRAHLGARARQWASVSISGQQRSGQGRGVRWRRSQLMARRLEGVGFWSRSIGRGGSTQPDLDVRQRRASHTRGVSVMERPGCLTVDTRRRWSGAWVGGVGGWVGVGVGGRS